MKDKCKSEKSETPKDEQAHSKGFLKKALGMKKSGKQVRK
jgi:hypothetical protein